VPGEIPVDDAPTSMRVTVNGAERDVPVGTTVAGLLVLLGLERARVAVERNRDVVPRKTYDDVTLIAGDKVEVVAFVGGG
jgi:thiamine biosynthesis protein ThiS